MLDVRGRTILPASLAAGVVGFAFTLLATRALGTRGFGDLSALVQGFTVLSVPISAASAAVARLIAEREARVPGSGAALGRGVAGPAVLIALAGCFVAILVLLALRAPLPFGHRVIGAFALATGATILAGMARGVAWGLRRYAHLSLSILIEPVIRLAAGAALAAIVPNVEAFLNCYVVGSLAAAWMGFSSLASQPAGHQRLRLGEFGPHVLNLAIAYGCIQVLCNVDILVARISLPAVEAGCYAAAATLTKAALLVQAAVGTVVYREALTRGQTHRVLARGMITGAGLIGLGIFPSVLIPRWVITTLFTAKYASASTVLPTLALAATVIAPNVIATRYYLARVPWRTLLPLGISTAACLTTFAMHHHSGRDVAQSLLVGPLVLGLGLLVGQMTGFLQGINEHSEIASAPPPVE